MISSLTPHPQQRVAWIDALRLLGALLIFLYHFVPDYELVFGEPYTAPGFASIFQTALPHFANWAISLFVMLAGLSLVMSWRAGTRAVRYFVRRGVRLLLPLWIVAVPYTVAAIIVGIMPAGELWKLPFWLLGIGVVSPGTYLPVSEAWWYVTLALQCALVTPLVMWLLDRIGLARTILAMAATGVLSVWVIGVLPNEWTYLTQGLVFARFVELAAGVLTAQTLLRRTDTVGTLGLALVLLTAAVLADGFGAITPVTVISAWMVVLLGSALLLGYAPASPGWLALAGVATYPFYLAHAPIGKYTVRILGGAGIDSPWLLAAVAFFLSAAVALMVMVVQERVSSILPAGMR